MELVSHTVGVASRTGEDVLVMPVGDIQWAGIDKQVAMKMLRRHIEWGVERGAYFLGMGDYIDMLSPSNRQRVKSAALYDTATSVLDKAGEALIDELWEKALAPSKGRWLGLLEGHHFHEFADGTTTDQYLASKLGTKFLGTSAYVRLRFVRGKRSGAGDVLIWCHHGVGTGTTSASILNRLQRLSAGFEADIYLMGHLHRKVAEPVDYTFPLYGSRNDVARLVHRTRLMACTGSFLKGYIAHNQVGTVRRGTYVEQKMLAPVSLGGIVITIKPRWKDTEAGTIWLPDLGVSQ